MSCQHPYDKVSDEHACFVFNGDHTLVKSDGGEVRVAVKFCTECSHIIDTESFEHGFPISRLNNLICTNEDCQHPYEFVVDEELSFTLEGKPIEPDKVPTYPIKLCEQCNTIIESETDKFPLTTI